MLNCHSVAKYFLSLADEDAGDLISNLKLQKLVYYAQGFYLAIYDKPLFSEQIKAWEHGPVVPELYRQYKEYGASGIPVPRDVNFDVFDGETEELLNEIYAVYGQFSAWKLRTMTHEEHPWQSTDLNDVISHEAMKTYFKTQLNA
ncbi:MAG: type II toxin-antitoxin system antitoxin SocA domain-containing protein [Cyanobacteria bacterium P01_E01_bin.6]